MRKNIIKVALVFGALAGITGCSSEDDLYREYEQNMQKLLSGAKVKDIDEYSQLGYVSVKNDNKQTKGRKNRVSSKELLSDNYFYLAGMVGEELRGLSLDGGNDLWDVPILCYAYLGNFIGFTPVSYGSYGYDVTTKCEEDICRSGYPFFSFTGSGYFDSGGGIEYLLSKKSGKIYNIKLSYDNQNNRYLDGVSFGRLITGSEVLYGLCRPVEGDQILDKTYWATITEENEQLKIEKSKMLEFISDKLNVYGDELFCYDKYGNILKSRAYFYDNCVIGDTIYGYNQKELECDLEGHLSYGYEPYTQTIYTYCDGSFYTLEGLEFKKYDNVIFGYGFEGGIDTVEQEYVPYLSHYFYYGDDNGDYKVGYDPEQYYYTDNYQVISGEAYTYGDYLLQSGSLYRKTGEYTFIYLDRKGIADSTSSSQYVLRDQYIYYITNDYKLIKYDFIEDISTTINTQGYKIKILREDSLGNIIVSGYDSSFDEFTGYLDENDSVTFEPVNVNDSDYDVIYMNPVN